MEVRPGWYELTDRFQQHHHYFICRLCDRRTSFNDERIEIDLGKFAEDRGLVLEDHRLELIGLCRYCTVNNDKPRAGIGTNLRRLPG